MMARPLRVVLVHNEYRSGQPSGENQSVEEEVKALEGAGVEVLRFSRSSDLLAELGPLRQAMHAVDPFGTPTIRREFRELLTQFRPDLVHVENLWPMISPAVVRISRQQAVPVVASIRNFRLSCVAGTHYRAGKNCFDCEQTTWPAVRNRCYQESAIKSIPMAAALRNFSNDLKTLDHYMPNSEFTGRYLQHVGVPKHRITIRPNSVPDSFPLTPLPSSRNLLFLGRLSHEKGVHNLLDAWVTSEHQEVGLWIAGDGPLRSYVDTVAQDDPSVRSLGLIDPSQVNELISAATAVVAPSLGIETFGRVAVEAFAAGRPVLATKVGGLGDVVSPESGWLAEPDVGSLRVAIEVFAASSPEELLAKGQAARKRYEAVYSPASNLQILMEVYMKVSRHAEGGQ